MLAGTLLLSLLRFLGLLRILVLLLLLGLLLLLPLRGLLLVLVLLLLLLLVLVLPPTLECPASPAPDFPSWTRTCTIVRLRTSDVPRMLIYYSPHNQCLGNHILGCPVVGPRGHGRSHRSRNGGWTGGKE